MLIESPAKGVQGYRVPGFLLHRRPIPMSISRWLSGFIPSHVNDYNYHYRTILCKNFTIFLRIPFFPDVIDANWSGFFRQIYLCITVGSPGIGSVKTWPRPTESPFLLIRCGGFRHSFFASSILESFGASRISPVVRTESALTQGRFQISYGAVVLIALKSFAFE